MLDPGDRSPSFTLPDIDTAEPVSDPWRATDGPTVLAFFKATCPVCQMAAPMVAAMAANAADVCPVARQQQHAGDHAGRIAGIGEAPAPTLAGYRDQWGQTVPTLSEPPPYRVSGAYKLVSVPTLYLVGPDGTILDAVGGWDRDGWNRMAVAAGAKPVSATGDSLPPFRPG